MKILFIDESGDHNLTVLDKDYPVFVLAGCIVDEVHHNGFLTAEIQKFKTEMQLKNDVILHYRDYTRNQNGYENMADEKFRHGFYEKLNHIITKTNFTLVACVIDKQVHKDKYGILALDPYTLVLQILVERFAMYLKQTKEKGIIIAESRGNQLDNELNIAYLNLKVTGTKYLRPIEILTNIDNFFIKKKEDNIHGLQLVDSLAAPIGRRYLRLKNKYIDYDTIKKKFRKIACGKYFGYGLVIMPKK